MHKSRLIEDSHGQRFILKDAPKRFNLGRCPHPDEFKKANAEVMEGKHWRARVLVGPSFEDGFEFDQRFRLTRSRWP